MHLFDRTNKMFGILIGSSVFFFIISVILLFKGSVGITFAICFLLWVFPLILGIALKCIVRDAKEELDRIKCTCDT